MVELQHSLAKTGGASSSIFAVKFGEGRLAGLTNGGIQVEDVGGLETKTRAPLALQVVRLDRPVLDAGARPSCYDLLTRHHSRV
jgi:hypothetical protein